MPFDAYLAARSDVLHGLTWDDMTQAENRARLEHFATDPAPWSMADVEVTDVLAPGPHGDVPVRVYRPREPERSGGLLWIHGGGFWAGDLDMPESYMVASELAVRTGLTVASVGYRLAVDGVHFPVPLDDVVAAWEWLVGELGTPAGVSIGGASAGGALALSAAVRLRDSGVEVSAGLYLAYPVVHFPVPTLPDDIAAEMRALPQLLRFSPEVIEGMFANYVGRLSAIPPLATPGHGVLAGLPPVFLMECEYDDLRPSADLLARQLVESGVEVTRWLATGMPHGHLNRTPGLPEVDASLDFFAAGLRGEVRD
jgi:acetyl esterase